MRLRRARATSPTPNLTVHAEAETANDSKETNTMTDTPDADVAVPAQASRYFPFGWPDISEARAEQLWQDAAAVRAEVAAARERADRAVDAARDAANRMIQTAADAAKAVALQARDDDQRAFQIEEKSRWTVIARKRAGAVQDAAARLEAFAGERERLTAELEGLDERAERAKAGSTDLAEQIAACIGSGGGEALAALHERMGACEEILDEITARQRVVRGRMIDISEGGQERKAAEQALLDAARELEEAFDKLDPDQSGRHGTARTLTRFTAGGAGA